MANDWITWPTAAPHPCAHKIKAWAFEHVRTECGRWVGQARAQPAPATMHKCGQCIVPGGPRRGEGRHVKTP